MQKKCVYFNEELKRYREDTKHIRWEIKIDDVKFLLSFPTVPKAALYNFLIKYLGKEKQNKSLYY